MDIQTWFKCYGLANSAHRGQKGRNGEDYIAHPVRVSKLLRSKGFAFEYQVVALFQDVLLMSDLNETDLLEWINKQMLDALVVLKNYPNNDLVSLEKVEANEYAKMIRAAKILDLYHYGGWLRKEEIHCMIEEGKALLETFMKDICFKEEFVQAIKDLEVIYHKK